MPLIVLALTLFTTNVYADLANATDSNYPLNPYDQPMYYPQQGYYPGYNLYDGYPYVDQSQSNNAINDVYLENQHR